MQNVLPCSVEALDQQNEMYIQGNNKLLTELAHAKAIPEEQRILIDKKYLEKV